MKSRQRLLSGALLCLTTLTAAALAVQSQRPRAAGFVPYTITWQMTEHYPDGRAVPAYRETRSNYSDGNWRSLITFPDGKTVEQVAEAGAGSFIVDRKTGKKSFFSKFPGRLVGDARRHNKWARSERLLGQVVEVLRFEVGGESHELYHAPRLNNDIIKTVHRGRGVTRVLEPVSIALGEPAS